MQAMRITGVGRWPPRLDATEATEATDATEAPPRPPATCLPARERRRASVLSRALATAFEQAVNQSGEDRATLATVFGSAYGEGATLAILLGQMHTDDGALSPMRFAGSVHNTASGMVSIACDARGFTTSIAAGQETLAACLIEAAGLLAAGHPAVAVVVGDCTPPPALIDDDETFDTAAAAFVVRAGGDETTGIHKPESSFSPGNLGFLLDLRLVSTTIPDDPDPDPDANDDDGDGDTQASTAIPANLRYNPCAPALQLAALIETRQAATLRLDLLPGRANGRVWQLRFEPKSAVTTAAKP